MFHSIQSLNGFKIAALDDTIGAVKDAYFDDERWGLRYFVAETGAWLSGRQVLVSPRSIVAIDWENKLLRVKLTREQVERSPSIDTHKPVSRQHELEYAQYYNFSPYWIGPDALGMVAAPPITPPPVRVDRAPGDPHLRSAGEVTGYYVAATDDDIGHVEDLLFDDKTFSIRYLVIDTRNWWPGKQVLVSPEWIARIDWAERKVFAHLTRGEIESSPEHDPADLREGEHAHAMHRTRRTPTYWNTRDEPTTPMSNG